MARAKRNLVQISVYLTEEQDKKLHRLSKITKIPAALYIREGLDVVLQQYKTILAGANEE